MPLATHSIAGNGFDEESLANNSLRVTVKTKIKDIILSVGDPHKVIIIDNQTVKVMDAVLKMSEILDHGVFLVENITKGRQAYPEMGAIYFLTPSIDNIVKLGEDFSIPKTRLASGRTGALYRSAHVFFTGTISKALMGQLAESPAAPYIRTLEEIYLNFIANDSRAFNLDNTLGAAGADMDSVAKGIASVCACLSQTPKIHFQVESSTLCQNLATRLDKSLADLSKTLNYKSKSSDSHLLIVDRSYDLSAVLLHEFTTQALANDVIGLGADGTRFEYQFSSPMGGPQTRTVCLDENDGMWHLIRHSHIAACTDIIIESFNKFMSENKAAIKSSSAASQSVATLDQLKETMGSLGQFQEMKREFSIYLTLAANCLDINSTKGLVDVGTCEQNIVTGLECTGERIKDCWNMVSELMGRPVLSALDRARLLTLYLLCKPKISSADQEVLFQAAQLSPPLVASVKKILTRAANSKILQSQRGPSKSRSKSICSIPHDYDVSRFIPAITILFEDMSYNELSSSDFKSITSSISTTANSSNSKASAGKTGVSLRASAGAKTTNSIGAGDNGGPLFIYVIGGITYSEIRGAYTMTKHLGRECYIGSDTILTPEKFIQLQ